MARRLADISNSENGDGLFNIRPRKLTDDGAAVNENPGTMRQQAATEPAFSLTVLALPSYPEL
jgi:hypothetical protein